MDYEFQLSAGYEREDLMGLNRLTSVLRPARRRNLLILRVVLAALGAGLLALAWTFWAGLPIFAVIFALLGVVALAFSACYYACAAAITRRLIAGGNSAITETLRKRDVLEKTERGETATPYTAFTGVYRRGGTYFLMMESNRALVLPTRCMTVGEAGTLEDFLREKTGKEITPFN